nr:bzip transcription factor 53 [Quercus suber]
MGKWDLISSISKSVIQNAPDLTTVKGLCLSSYGYGWAAVAKVDDVVRTKVIQSMQDEEARSEIGRIATNFAKTAAVLACKEGLKTIPGGSLFYKIVLQSLHNEKKSGGNEVETKALRAKISKMEEEITELKKLIGRADLHKPFADFKPEKSSSFEPNVDIKPEDAIRVFMMKESIGGSLFYKIALQALHNEKKSGGNEVETKALQAKISKMDEDFTEFKKLIERAKIHKPFADFKPEKSSSFEPNVDIKPEDAIKVFMMKESIEEEEKDVVESRICEDLTNEVTQLQLSNRDLVQKINTKEQNYGAIESANNIVRALHAELTDRLRSLNSVLQMIEEMSGFSVDILEIPDSMMNPWQLNHSDAQPFLLLQQHRW